MGTTCGSLLIELQKIWDEIGEDDDERDKMLYELEQECLEAYRRKVDEANRSRAQLRQAVADAEAQLADICAALGERPSQIKKSSGGLNQELETIMPQLEEMIEKRNERKSQFAEVVKQINSFSMELSGFTESSLDVICIDESDLSLKRLDDLRSQLLLLQKEKDKRLKQLVDLLNVVNTHCLILGMDSKSTICGVHPSLDGTCERNISADTIRGLSAAICRLKNVKLQRMQRLQELAMTMVELWTLMDTPVEEQQMFQNVTRTIAASEDEIAEANSLSLDIINYAEAEVLRLQDMKMSKIKEVLLKKKVKLEEICHGAHMIVGQFGEDFSLESIESGAISPSYLLEELEVRISTAKEEAFSRKEILEKVQKWLAACEEECWLEEYSRVVYKYCFSLYKSDWLLLSLSISLNGICKQDDNRYNGGRGAHVMLKRAEKARVLVNKIPGMVEALKSKVHAWEKKRNSDFLYDGVGLIYMLDQYCELKQLKEQERKIQRNEKKLQGQLIAEQETIYGSKLSPSKSGVKNVRPSTGGGIANKRSSLGGAALQRTLDKSALSSRTLQKNKRQTSNKNHHTDLTTHSTGNASIAHHTGSSTLRKALSPLSSLCSNVISCNHQDQNTKSAELHDTQTGYKTPAAATPSKRYSGNDENRTPKSMPIPVPPTPLTMCSPMLAAKTPFTPGIRATKEIEYSFEEIRAGFVDRKVLNRTLSLD